VVDVRGAAITLAAACAPRRGVGAGAGGEEALLFLLALLALSALLEASGFFEWAAVLAARSARSGAGLLANVLVLGTLITFVLSLDTTAVILTPLVVATVQRLEVRPRPYILLCVFLPSVASTAASGEQPDQSAARRARAGRAVRRVQRAAAARGLFVLWAGIRLACRGELVPRLTRRRCLPRRRSSWTGRSSSPPVASWCLLVLGYFVGPCLAFRCG
jgi:hypothetical protein